MKEKENAVRKEGSGLPDTVEETVDAKVTRRVILHTVGEVTRRAPTASFQKLQLVE